MSGNDTKISELNCPDFVSVLGSAAPVPGGGGAAALCGAVGTALGNMVASLTIGKKKYADVEDLMISLKKKCECLQKDLLQLIDEDAEGFAPLAAAYKLPKDTPEQIEYREKVLEDCSAKACEVPIKIMEKCAEAMDCIVRFAERGSIMAISDAGAGMVICKAALQAASLNVFINTQGMKDRDTANDLNAKVRELLYIYENKADNIFEMVQRELTRIKQ